MKKMKLICMLGALAALALGPASGAELRELTKVPLNGVDTYIYVQSKTPLDAANQKPLLLVLHGGPGFAMMGSLAGACPSLLDEFVIIDWDQRGAGHSYVEGKRLDMRFDTMVADAHDLTAYLIQRYQRPKVYLLGHSFGTMLGSVLVAKYPDLYEDLIATGFAGDVVRNERGSRDWALQEAQRLGHQTAIQELTAIGDPGPLCNYPNYTNPVHGQTVDTLSGSAITMYWVGQFGGEVFGRTGSDEIENAIRGSDLYKGIPWDAGWTYSQEIFSQSQLSDFDLWTRVKSVSVPVHFFQGVHDADTPYSLAKDFYNQLKVEGAGAKSWVDFTNSAHFAFLEEPDNFSRELLSIVRSKASPTTPPTITAQPQSQSVASGASVTFAVAASGTEPLTYQWKFNGADLSGATGPTLTLSNVQSSNAGNYSATVRNSAGSVTSTVALLSVRSLPPPPPSRNRWTIMIYGHADHNLSGSLVADMQEMEATGSGPDFNVVLQADFDASSDRNAEAGLPAELAKGVTRFLMQKDSDPNTITSPPVERRPEMNLDDPKNLTDFITWAAQKYPADRYGLVLWDHGGQWEGYGGDSQDGTLKDKGVLTTAQIRQAVSAAMPTAGISKWEFVAFDTCLMGGAEVLTDFVPLTDVFIACPEIDYGDGWDYAATLDFLKTNPAVSALDFGRAEVKAWEAHHMQPGKDSDLQLASHALYDLTKYATFQEKFNAFSTLLTQAATPQNMVLPRLRLDTTQYSLSGMKDIGKPTAYIDVGELADRLAVDPTTDAALKAAATSLVSSIDAMVVAKVRGVKKQLTRGLSAYYPPAGAKDNQAYFALTISSQPGSAWTQFLARVTDNKGGDNSAPEVAQADVALASLAPLSSAAGTFSASIAQPANLRVKVVNGADAYAIYASVVDNHFTSKTNEYVYLGEVLNAPANGVGTYSIQWNGTLPLLSSSAGTNSAILGGFFDDVGSDVLVSYAEYAPPKSADTQFVALLTRINDNSGKVISALDAEVEELAPAGIDLEPGGTLTPFYYLERRQGNDPEKWVSDDVRGKASIVIPTNGLSGLIVNLAQLPPGTYTLEAQVVDAYENESDVLEYLISVGPALSAPSLTVQPVAPGMIKLTWPAAVSDFALEVNTTLTTAGWNAIPPSQVTLEGSNRVFTEAIANPTRFYRLKKN